MHVQDNVIVYINDKMKVLYISSHTTVYYRKFQLIGRIIISLQFLRLISIYWYKVK